MIVMGMFKAVCCKKDFYYEEEWLIPLIIKSCLGNYKKSFKPRAFLKWLSHF